MAEYKSPIEMDIATAKISEKINKETEKLIITGVQEIGVNVDKHELIKALKYDRDQFNIGFNMGYEQACKETAGAILNHIKVRYEESAKTSQNYRKQEDEVGMYLYRGGAMLLYALGEWIKKEYSVEVENDIQNH